MRFLTVVGVFFYALVVIFVGILMILFSLGVVQPENISNLLTLIIFSINSRIIIFLSGVLLILVSISFAQIILGRIQRERTIAFKIAQGEVTIALSAVEDLIKRLTGLIPEIKELRPDVIATKKGIIVDLMVILKSETNIPDITQRLQEITKSKIQEVLGVEEQIIIKIHVIKIISHEDKEKRKKDAERIDTNIPFGGYRT